MESINPTCIAGNWSFFSRSIMSCDQNVRNKVIIYKSDDISWMHLHWDFYCIPCAQCLPAQRTHLQPNRPPSTAPPTAWWWPPRRKLSSSCRATAPDDHPATNRTIGFQLNQRRLFASWKDKKHAIIDLANVLSYSNQLGIEMSTNNLLLLCCG